METVHDGHRAFFTTGGFPLDAGKPSVVFVHGAGMDHTVWTLFVRYFARNGFNALAVDLPGHGRSEGAPLATIDALAGWLLALLEHLRIERAVLAGHSMGALIALQAAATGGERVQKAALLGFNYPMQVGQPLLDAARDDDHAAIDMLMIWGHDFRAQIGGNAVPGLSIITCIKRIVERAAPGVLYSDLHACHTYDGGAAAAGRIRCPVTLILGDRDRMTPVRGAREFMRSLAHPVLELIADCGHGMMEERPEETHQALARVLAG